MGFGLQPPPRRSIARQRLGIDEQRIPPGRNARAAAKARRAPPDRDPPARERMTRDNLRR
jgi:hypothetical protein